ncbi:hypothetical protein B0H63DRAFT_477534 [Podospora didyma]|uniref:F-box domain-containing protein n=1 Tax=Podospora didyma TaxID=330526 RepID=A0AAE0KIY3_9PEZI|nr:hypothetical protein B0H63DRAFT_477534 [Podospora didyma]
MLASNRWSRYCAKMAQQISCPILSVPDEILDAILLQAAGFTEMPEYYGRWSRSHLLLHFGQLARVCRRFHRLVTPRLYSVVVLKP